MKLRYSLNSDGKVDGVGYKAIFPYEVGKDTPFQTINESQYWKKVNNEWVKYDPTWLYDQFSVRVTIPDNVILNNDLYLQLKRHVILLESQGNAGRFEIENNQVMYFIRLLPEHEKILKEDENVKIEYKIETKAVNKAKISNI